MAQKQLFIVLISFLLCSPLLASTVPQNGLVGWWRADGGTAEDHSGNGHHGTMQGGISFVDNGEGGTAFQLDGTSGYIALPLSYSGESINELSVVVRFRTDFSNSNAFSNWSFLDFDRSEYFNFFAAADTGTLGFSSDSSGIDDFYGNTVVNDNQWHTVAAVYNGQDKILYVDGNEDARKVNPHGGAAISDSVTRFSFIGDGSEASSFDGSRNNHHYEGLIDEVLFYERALSDSEIANINFNATVPEPSPLGLFTFCCLLFLMKRVLDGGKRKRFLFLERS